MFGEHFCISLLYKLNYCSHNYRSNRFNSIPHSVVAETRRNIISLGRMINETIQDKSMSDINETQHRYNYNCDSNAKLIFASSDVHDGPRTDISFTLLRMNQSFVHLGPRNATRNYPRGNDSNMLDIYHA